MAQSLSKILLHIIFRTKDELTLLPRDLLPSLHAYISSVSRSNKSVTYCVGGIDDHVHIACSLPRDVTVSDLVRSVKSSSSAWIKSQCPTCNHFEWQAGYGVFSLGQSQLESITKYIKGQEEHHRHKSYRDELIDFLEKYKVEYNKEYL